MKPILTPIRKLSDKLFGRAADAFVGEQVFQNTAPDPLTKAANASCGAETSEGAPAPSDHKDEIPRALWGHPRPSASARSDHKDEISLDVLLIAREAEASVWLDEDDSYSEYAASVRNGDYDHDVGVLAAARAVLMDREQRSAAEADLSLPPYPWWGEKLKSQSQHPEHPDRLVVYGPENNDRHAFILAYDLSRRFENCSVAMIGYIAEEAIRILKARTRVSADTLVIPEVKDGVLQPSYFE